MKKIVLLTLLSLICLKSNAQQRKLNLTDFKTWSLQANGALNWAHTDVVQNSPFYSSVNYNAGYGIRLNKFLTHNLGLSLDGYRTQFKGVDGIWSYDTKINYQISLLAMFQSGNIRYLTDFENFQLYGYVGYGTINYESSLINSNNSIKNNTVKENEQVIPVGVGIKYHLKDNITLNLEYSLSSINSDNLDAFNDRFTEQDSYSKLQLGIAYTFGKFYNKELEWHDPRPRITNQPVKKDTVIYIQKVICTDTINSSNKNSVNESLEDSLKKDSIEIANSSVTIFYDFNEYKLPESYELKLKEISYQCSKRKNSKIVIESFTDTIGSTNNNIVIVERRAREIKNFLTKSGLSQDYILIKLHGEDKALMPTDAENRKSTVYLVD